ncbi:hypothetical protein MKX03_005453 [Papaver bracteatum]|nr:hypothetical protein MKX03_005453 [Papaver bracteatum]
MWDGSLVVAANNNGTCYVWRLQRGTQCLLSPGQIARATTIFRVDEVVIFDNNSGSDYDLRLAMKEDADVNESGTQFLIRILKYLETPQYLRRALFKMHTSLRFVGLLLPLDDPHHLRKNERGSISGRGPNNTGTQVDVGLTKNIVIDQNFEPEIRVTVTMGTDRCMETEEGSYWGYKFRYTPNIISVFKDFPFEILGAYDQNIGTSENGVVINSSELTIPTFRSGFTESIILGHLPLTLKDVKPIENPKWATYRYVKRLLCHQLNILSSR